MIEDLQNYIANYYNNLNIGEIEKIVELCHTNTNFIKFIILTIKYDINLLDLHEGDNKWTVKCSKQLLKNMHQKKKDILKVYSNNIKTYSLKKNNIENTDKIIKSINELHSILINDINSIEKLCVYLNDPKYNIESSLKSINGIEYIEQYSNSSEI
jgi:hypothetical protein